MCMHQELVERSWGSWRGSSGAVAVFWMEPALPAACYEEGRGVEAHSGTADLHFFPEETQTLKSPSEGAMFSKQEIWGCLQSWAVAPWAPALAEVPEDHVWSQSSQQKLDIIMTPGASEQEDHEGKNYHGKASTSLGKVFLQYFDLACHCIKKKPRGGTWQCWDGYSSQQHMGNCVVWQWSTLNICSAWPFIPCLSLPLSPHHKLLSPKPSLLWVGFVRLSVLITGFTVVMTKILKSILRAAEGKTLEGNQNILINVRGKRNQ